MDSIIQPSNNWARRSHRKDDWNMTYIQAFAFDSCSVARDILGCHSSLGILAHDQLSDSHLMLVWFQCSLFTGY